MEIAAVSDSNNSILEKAGRVLVIEKLILSSSLFLELSELGSLGLSEKSESSESDSSESLLV